VWQPVAFPTDGFDLFEFCTPALQAKMKVHRDRWVQRRRGVVPSLRCCLLPSDC
jgi:hypothetical protein